MSCFIVSNESLNRVVQAARALDCKHRYEYLGKAFKELGYDLETSGEVLGQDLFDMNVDAFCQRYPAEKVNAATALASLGCRTLPLTCRTRYPEDIGEPFEYYAAMPAPLTREALIQAHKSASCLLYQCSEGDVPERPLFKALEAFVQRLADEFITIDPRWEEALWG
jgi:hypothetical protein